MAGIAHILIQKFASQIAINIEDAFHGTYGNNVIEQIRQVGISQTPIKEINGHNEQIESYWHSQGIVDTNLEHHHGWDFDSY